MTDQIKAQARSTQNATPKEPTLSNGAFSVVRVLRWYEKSGDQLLGEASLDSIKLSDLQMLFQESADNLMVDCYPVSIAQVDRLQREIAESIDLSAYDYYLECDAV